MNNPEAIAEEFDRIRNGDIEEYEAELAAAQDAAARIEERSKVMTGRLRKVAKEHELDLATLHSVHGDEDEHLSRYLAEIRPELLDRPSGVQSDLRVKAMYAPALDAAPVERVEPIGSLLLAPDIEHFAGMQGERGNPWLIPNDSGRLHIGQKYSGAGTGSGCWGVGYIYSPDVAHVYFSYTPPKTGILSIQAWTVLHGFYVAKANDGCFTCKMAKAYATMSIATHQIGVWQTGDEFKICDIDADNVDTYGIIDKGVHLNTTRPVLGGAPVVIRVSVVVGTLAKGSGSYAEVDFKSKSKSGGELNYIWIPCVVASYAK